MSKQATLTNWELKSLDNGTLIVTLFGNDHHYINDTGLTEENIGDQARVTQIKNVLGRTDVAEIDLLELITEIVYKEYI